MKKRTIPVPKGIRYISEWREQYGFTLPNYPCIINKQITGCGFTEDCIRSEENVILCSPRRMLLENKFQQHPGEVYYARNDSEQLVDIDKDLNVSKKSKNIPKLSYETTRDMHLNLIDGVKDYVIKCAISKRPCKILVTYDSFRLVREAIDDIGVLTNFRVVIDEFQSIFTDATFKATTGMELLYHLRGIDNLNFVSATPMIDSYLEEMKEFCELHYIDLDWITEDPIRVIQPELKVRSMSGTSLQAVSNHTIQEYLDGNFETAIVKGDDGLVSVESRELIIYVNSVKNICDIIRRSGLKPEQVNILCSNSPENLKKINNSLKVLDNGKYEIGSVPLPGETNKMFTFCTRTVYLGADFYSTNARSMILSDANIDCLAVDITLDLPQILGRQRLECNPWKNRAELYVKLLTTNNKVTQDEFNRVLNAKETDTDLVLEGFAEITTADRRNSIAKMLKTAAETTNYKNNYVSVNSHQDSTLTPIFNKLVQLSERRAFEIQQIDYANRFNIFNAIREEGMCTDSIISDLINKFYRQTSFPNRMKLLCESGLNEVELSLVFKQIPAEYSKYYYVLGPEKISSCGDYERNKIDKAYNKVIFSKSKMISNIYDNFSEGEKLSTADIIDRLQVIYNSHNNPNRPKAVDIGSFFEIKAARITLPDKSRIPGFKLIKKLY